MCIHIFVHISYRNDECVTCVAPNSFDEFLSVSAYCRDRINPYLFNYALSSAVMHRSDTRNVTLPSHAELFPNLYIDPTVLGRAREEAMVVKPGSRVSQNGLVIDYVYPSLLPFLSPLRTEKSVPENPLPRRIALFITKLICSS